MFYILLGETQPRWETTSPLQETSPQLWRSALSIVPIKFCVQLQRGLIWAQGTNRSNIVLGIFCCVPAHYSHKEILVLGYGQRLDEEAFEAEYKQDSGYTDGQRKRGGF